MENEVSIYKEQPVFDGQYSNQCYINRITEAYEHFKKESQQTGKVYEKGWNIILADEIPIIILVKDGTVIPHIKLAQSTKDMDWSQIALKVYAADANEATGNLYLPNDTQLQQLILEKSASGFVLKNNPVVNETSFTIN